MNKRIRHGLSVLSLPLLLALGVGCSDDDDGNQPSTTTQPDADDLQEGDIERGDPNTQDESNEAPGTNPPASGR